MALKAKYEARDQIPEGQEEFYVEDESAGGFILDVESAGGYGLEDVTGLKTSLSREREAAKKARAAVQAFGDLDPDKAREALEKVAEMSSWKPDDKVREQLEARETAINAKWQKEYDELKALHSSVSGQLEGHLVDAQATIALSEAGGNAKLLLPHIKSQVKVEPDEDGRFRVRVVDGKGTPRLSNRRGQSGDMTISELVAEMADSDTFAPAFQGSGASGSGNVGGQAGGQRAGMAHRISYEDAKNPSRYAAAKEAAQKAGAQLEIGSYGE